MRVMHKILVVLAAATLFTACEEPKHDAKDTVFTPQVKALEKARAVEDMVQQNAERTRAAVDSIGQESESRTEH